MSLINPVGLHHLRITVTDLARSRAFYQDVLGFAVVAESPGDPSDPRFETIQRNCTAVWCSRSQVCSSGFGPSPTRRIDSFPNGSA
jgi:catechol 2,3-dioxygenase-like lactoylglutathione lyase family enzyme